MSGGFFVCFISLDNWRKLKPPSAAKMLGNSNKQTPVWQISEIFVLILLRVEFADNILGVMGK